MHILDKIVEHKKLELYRAKKDVPMEQLVDSKTYHDSAKDFPASVKSGPGIIAEFKRRSPSRPTINLDAQAEVIAEGYAKAGVSAMSVLTDSHFFGGSFDDIRSVRKAVDLPLLRKDFMIDPYQIHEAKSVGADAILLITEILSKGQIQDLAGLAKEIGLYVLMEIHTKQQLDKYTEAVDMVGVNNRDLTNFKVDYSTSLDLFGHLPADVVKISESGIHDVQVIHELKAKGFDGFLIGERFMKTDNPGQSCAEFIHSVMDHQSNEV